MRILQLVDSIEYVRDNCWQHQIFASLTESFDKHNVLTVSQLQVGDIADLASYDVILSTLKLRTLLRNVVLIGKRLKNRPIFVYDTDPCVSFIDDVLYKEFKGSYTIINNVLNVKSFVCIQKTWKDILSNKGFPVECVKPWPRQEYCNSNRKWSTKNIKAGFVGILHPYRKNLIDNLSKLGVSVLPFSSMPFQQYLNLIDDMQFFLHAEDETQWYVDGEPVDNACGWGKEIEIAAKGCFPIRKWEKEADDWYLDDIKSIITVKSIEEIPDIMNDCIKNVSRSDNISREGIDFISKKNPWYDLVKILRHET